jgi:F-type H+-transporting ATPase subunit delta
MQAASRQTFAAVQEHLDALAPDTPPEQLRRVADELLSVAGLLADQPRLRRALSDPARPGADRAGLLAGLIGDQVSEQTRELLELLVSGRWSAGGELLTGCEELGVQALLASAERQGILAEVEDELFRFARTLEANEELLSVLADPHVPSDRRTQVVQDLLEGKASDTTVAVVSLVVGTGRARDLGTIVDKLVESSARAAAKQVAEVRVAQELTDEQRSRLAAGLAQAVGSDVDVKVIVDPSVLGGVVAQIGDRVIDGSVRTRLNQLREAF